MLEWLKLIVFRTFKLVNELLNGFLFFTHFFVNSLSYLFYVLVKFVEKKWQNYCEGMYLKFKGCCTHGYCETFLLSKGKFL